MQKFCKYGVLKVNGTTQNMIYWTCVVNEGSCHKRQKPLAPTPQAPIRNRQTRKVANAKGTKPQY